jgi:hypothetical protein
VSNRHPIRVRTAADKRHLIDRLANHTATRAGLDEVLDELNRRATQRSIPAVTAATGFTWEHDDSHDPEWWPQGITTSADASATGEVSGREVVMVSWYAHKQDGFTKGTRLSIVDWTDPTKARYRHVLLVDPLDDKATDRVSFGPVPVHAGGIVWYGKFVFVAGTATGIRVFNVDDIIRVPAGGSRRTIGIDARGHWHTYGYDYVLPESFAYKPGTARGIEKMRYSFLSLDRSASPQHHLVAGEYARKGQTTRLVRYAFDGDSGLLMTDDHGEAFPIDLIPNGVFGMQGATVVDDTWYVTTSNGRYRRGDLWIGEPGKHLQRRRWRLAIGPEDITYWPQLDQLWTLCEYPGCRYVFGMPRGWLNDPLLRLLRHRL